MTETWRVRFPITSFVQDVLQRKVAESGLHSLSAPELVLLTTTSLWSAAARSDLRAWFSHPAGQRIGDAIHALSAVGAIRLASIVRAQADHIASRESAEFFECVADAMMRCEDPLETLVAEYAATFQGGIDLQDAPVVVQLPAAESADATVRMSLSDGRDDLIENYSRLGNTMSERITASGIDVRSFVVLGFLAETPPQTVESLAVLMDLSLSSTRHCVEDLMKQGFAQSTHATTPGISTIEISVKGRRFLDRANEDSSSIV
jgi:hypothetical protein